MDSATTQKLRDLLTKNDKVGIVVGSNPTVDEMGAALALFLALNKDKNNTYIASATPPIVELSSLVGIDRVKTTLGAEGDLIVSFPYKEGEIEKVSYTLEEGYLNIVVKAGLRGLQFSESDVSYKRGKTLPSLLFVIGTPRLSDLGNLYDVEGLKDAVVVNIDNKRENQGFGDVVLVSNEFSSVSEQVATILQSLNLEIDIDVAQNLLSGILVATNNFQNPSTTPTAFEVSAFLMKKGAVRTAPLQVQQPADPFFTPKTTDLSGKMGKFERPQDRKREQDSQKQDIKPQQMVQDRRDKKDFKEPPSDWLVPKVYKGSTNI